MRLQLNEKILGQWGLGKKLVGFNQSCFKSIWMACGENEYWSVCEINVVYLHVFWNWTIVSTVNNWGMAIIVCMAWI